ncbi:MAG TPA: AI-2E family transporter [Thermoanaerobaculia bacterium]|nr:AI-2E family transporter [Thermoanaerobaculia bacterium]
MPLDSRSRIILPAAAVVVVIAGLRAADSILIPFMVAVFVTVLSLPILFWLQKLGMPRAGAVLITITGAAAVLAGAGFLVTLGIVELADRLPQYRQDVDEGLEEIVAWLNERGFEVNAADLIDPQAAVDLVQSSTARIAIILQDTILVLLLVVFMLFEAAYFPAKLRAAMGDRLVRDVARVTQEVQRYLVVKTVMCMAVGLATGLWVWFCGVDYPVFWGLFAFVMHYIPNVGAFLASIPPVLLAVFENGVGTAVLLALGFTVINTALGNLVEPALMGRRFGLSTLVVFVSLVFWGWVWGPVGMLLSVPLTIIIKIVLEGSEEWRWLGILLGPARPPAEAAVAVEGEESTRTA